MKPHPLVEFANALPDAVLVTWSLQVIKGLSGIGEEIFRCRIEEVLEASLEAVYVDPRLNAAVRVHATDATEEPVDFLADGLNDAE